MSQISKIKLFIVIFFGTVILIFGTVFGFVLYKENLVNKSNKTEIFSINSNSESNTNQSITQKYFYNNRKYPNFKVPNSFPNWRFEPNESEFQNKEGSPNSSGIDFEIKFTKNNSVLTIVVGQPSVNNFRSEPSCFGPITVLGSNGLSRVKDINPNSENTWLYASRTKYVTADREKADFEKLKNEFVRSFQYSGNLMVCRFEYLPDTTLSILDPKRDLNNSSKVGWFNIYFKGEEKDLPEVDQIVSQIKF